MATGTATKTLKSFGLTCPSCGESEAINLDLNDLTGEIQCGNCTDTYTVAVAVKKVGDQLARWKALEKWIGLAGECLADAE